MFALPRITAPAARSRLTTKPSSGGWTLASAIDPALVSMSKVSKLSLSTIGMPCSGPRTVPRLRLRQRRRLAAKPTD
jgi:hypothetical protein